jgi:Ser/Thr protein kinase RdoA (MazF antagonist)
MRRVCLIENSLTCDYIEGSELKESNEQYKLITLLLNERKESKLFGFKSPSPSIEEIFKELKDNGLLSKLSDNKYWGNIHGDLHPANILIDEKKAIVIDWDMAGEGYIWFDYLTLITHPWLKISKAERLELFIKKFSDFNKKESLQLFEYFRQFKAAQLSNFINQDASMKGLVSLYKLPLGEVI